MEQVLRDIVGDGLTETSESTPSVDGVRPAWIAAPSTVEQVAATVRAARAEGWGLIPLGSGRLIGAGV